jgi:hypothetical protein
MKTTLLLLIMLLLTSCDQTGLGVMAGVSNFITTPYRAIRSAIADSEYEAKRGPTMTRIRNLEQERREGRNLLQCGRPDSSPAGQSGLNDVADVLRATRCECIPWGSCTTEVCACDRLCPNDFTIFHHPPGQTLQELSAPSNELAFRNARGAMGGTSHASTNGYCWGHANVTAQFNRMAFFDRNQRPPFNINSTNPTEQRNAITYYKDLIDKVTSNKATSIPGFGNLAELSELPALQSYIADKVAESWADSAMTFQGLYVGLRPGHQGADHYRRIFAQTKERLDMGIQPIISFTRYNQSFDTHATLVSHYEETPNGIKLCLRDSNLPSQQAASCTNAMYLDQEGRCIYSGWRGGDSNGQIGGVVFAHNNNDEMVEQADELTRRCRRDKNCGQ